jgi:hypothetical protein
MLYFVGARSSTCTCAATIYYLLRTPPARPRESDFWRNTGQGNLALRIWCGVFEPDAPRLVFVQIFARNVVLWHLVRVNFLLIGGVSSFYARHHVGLERVPFLDQFVDALRVCALGVR